MKDLIYGIHSIIEAIKNPRRRPFEIYSTREGFQTLLKKGQFSSATKEQLTPIYCSPHGLQEKAKKLCQELDFNYQRVPSQVFLLGQPLEDCSFDRLYQNLKAEKGLRIVCLDGVTDVQNAAAIMRSAAFFGVDYVVVSMKGVFGKGPTFSRTASGSLEYVPIIKCASLPKTLLKFKKEGVLCVGLSEHAQETSVDKLEMKSLCLVLGAEDKGLSSAVSRTLDHTLALRPAGQIKSLNVSVAAGLAMNKFFFN